MNLMHGDCLELMREIPDGSVDMILCDLPYGTTACKWDSVIPFEPLWEQYKRVIKRSGAVVLTASQPFTTALIASNVGWFKYCWVWEKSRPSGFVQAKNKPMSAHEDIVVFSSGVTVHEGQSVNRMPYFPQGLVQIEPVTIQKRSFSNSAMGVRPSNQKQYTQSVSGYPKTVLRFSSASATVHPTQKPIALMEYLIRTYTNEGETVLDNCMGSGTTGVACVNTGRDFIGIEKDDKYFQIASERIAKAAGLELEAVGA